MSVGKTLKKIRKEKDMTQVEFAKYLDMSRSFIGDIENERYTPNPHTIEKISKKLGISTYYLTTGNKTLADISEEEYKELVTQYQIENQFKIKQDFKDMINELLEVDVSISQKALLRLTVTFMQQSSDEEMDELTHILRALSTNRYAHSRNLSDYDVNYRIKMADGIINDFKHFVYEYYQIDSDTND